MEEIEKKMELMTITLQTIIKKCSKEGEGKLDNEDAHKTIQEGNNKKGEEMEKESAHVNPQLDDIDKLHEESSIFNNYFKNHM